jgi:hypothetical protein
MTIYEVIFVCLGFALVIGVGWVYFANREAKLNQKIADLEIRPISCPQTASADGMGGYTDPMATSKYVMGPDGKPVIGPDGKPVLKKPGTPGAAGAVDANGQPVADTGMGAPTDMFTSSVGSGGGSPSEAAAPKQTTSIAPATPGFYRGGIRMGTTYCAGHDFACSDAITMQGELTDVANECIQARFGIEHKIMATFTSDGEFANCVLPSNPVNNARGMREWAICCVKKNAGADGQCGIECTRYINQNDQ